MLSEFNLRSFTYMLLTIALAFMGSLLFIYLHLPLPWLLGAITATSILVRFDSIPMKSPKLFSSPARIIIGLTIGSSFTPEILKYVDTYLYSLLFVIPFTLMTLFAGMYYFIRFQGFDKQTAYLSAMPGGVIEMIILAEDIKANISKITLVQSSRLFFIITTLPFIIQYILDIDIRGNNTITTPFIEVEFIPLVILLFLGLLSAMAAKKVKISGAYLMGPMIISIILHGTGVTTVTMPDEFLKFVQVVFGTIIGFTFKGVSFKVLVKTLFSTLGHFFILVSISSIFITIVYFTFDFKLISVLLAFSPGGQAEINLIAILVNASVPYITLHHIIRLLFVMNIAPIFAKRL